MFTSNMIARHSSLLSACVLAALVTSSCSKPVEPSVIASPDPVPLIKEATFSNDVAFLKAHTPIVVLKDATGSSKLVVAPAWQGRVMTSTAVGDGGSSYGWLNRSLIEQGIKPLEEREGLESHIYAFGGEDRFWIGPEGGQYSWYFKPGSKFEFSEWVVPDFIDTLSWDVISQSDQSVMLGHSLTLQNWSDERFEMDLKREVVLLDAQQALSSLDITGGSSVKVIAYESRNTIVNSGGQAWTKQTGMPSIWILGMLKHGPETTVVVPLNRDAISAGETVKDDYFGKVPASRLRTDANAGVLYFSGDGTFRSKIGISQTLSQGLAGSWDGARNVLTIVTYNVPEAGAEYVNSSWEMQADPFSGVPLNSYNDGPVDGAALGPFYELETSSPALPLAPGAGYTHTHRTIHIEGTRENLDAIATQVFGVNLKAIENGLSENTN